jgi:pimeloyl-ACP methyl ester carboxylesterase
MLMNDLQQQVQEAIDELVESGAERGLQVAVYRHGEPVVDAVAGVADPATGRPVTSDTPFYTYSTGKGATATVAHVLVERGVFGYDTRIVELWPEFGAHGKQAATVRHVLTHTVGVPSVPADTTPEDLCNWQKMYEVIAAAEPWWEPGTKTAYHASVMPERGETMASFGGSELGPWMDPGEEDGTMGIKAELAPDAFMQDCDEETVAGALERLTRQPLAAFGQAPRGVAWREKPSTYVVCAEDRATSPEAQREYAKRAEKVVGLPTGHHPMLSRPGLLARVISEAAATPDA